MEIQEKRELIESLQTGKETLVRAISGVTDEFAQRRPDAERWSILECMEHVAIAEEYLLGLATSASTTETPTVNKGREALIRKRGADRSRRIEAPEVAKPNGRFRTLDEASRYFIDSRRRTLDFVENCTTDFRAMTTTHPIAGQVNCYEMLLIMSAHPFRHAEQIREIRST